MSDDNKVDRHSKSYAMSDDNKVDPHSKTLLLSERGSDLERVQGDSCGEAGTNRSRKAEILRKGRR